MRRVGAAVLALLVLSACGEGDSADKGSAAESPAVAGTPSTQPPPAPPRVLERFEVGATVYVRALAIEPASNSLWVGTSGGVHEVDMATGALRNTFTRDHGLANEYVFAIGIDHRGRKWFGTNAGGVSRYRDGDWKTFFPMHGLADYWVYSFANQSDGTLWIGTWAGVTRVDAESGEFSNYLDELINEWVYGITVDSRDRVWFATEGGVSMFDGTRWSAWTHRDGLGAPNDESLPPSKNTGLGTRSRHDLGVLRGGRATYNPNYVFAIHAAPDDTIWVGTWGGGVSRFDGANWRNYTTSDGLAGNIVYSIARDRDGAFWFGTDGGLSRYDGERWHTFDRSSGLMENHVYAIAAAPSGDVWVGTRGGVTHIGR
jgi:ligand-binding sensor domain-containing protein